MNKIDLQKIKGLLLSDKVSNWKIWKDTGVSRSTISKIRRGEQSFEHILLSTALSLQPFVERHLVLENDGSDFIISPKELHLKEIEDCILDPSIPTKEIVRNTELTSMERSLLKNKKRKLSSFSLSKIISIQKYISNRRRDIS